MDLTPWNDILNRFKDTTPLSIKKSAAVDYFNQVIKPSQDYQKLSQSEQNRELYNLLQTLAPKKQITPKEADVDVITGVTPTPAPPKETESLLKLSGKAAMTGALQIPKAIASGGSIIRDKFGMEESTFTKTVQEAEQYWKTKPQTTLGRTVTGTGNTIGSMLTTLPLGGLVAMSTVSGINVAGEAYQEGAPLSKALLAGAVDTQVQYWTEKLPLHYLLKGGTNYIKRLGQGFLSDVPGEFLATLSEMYIEDTKILGKKYTPEQYTQALIDTFNVSGLTTFLSTTAIHSFIKEGTQEIDPKKLAKAIKDIVNNERGTWGAPEYLNILQGLKKEEALPQEVADKLIEENAFTLNIPILNALRTKGKLNPADLIRVPISDVKLKVKTLNPNINMETSIIDAFTPPRRPNVPYPVSTFKEGKLEDFIDEPEVFQKMPWLRNIKIEIKPDLHGAGAYANNTIYLNSNEPIIRFKDYVIHEQQHAIEHKIFGAIFEGSSPDRFPHAKAWNKTFKEMDAILKKDELTPQDNIRITELMNIREHLQHLSHQQYRSVIGEMIARYNAETGHLTKEKLISQQPLSSTTTKGIPRFKIRVKPPQALKSEAQAIELPEQEGKELLNKMLIILNDSSEQLKVDTEFYKAHPGKDIIKSIVKDKIGQHINAAITYTKKYSKLVDADKANTNLADIYLKRAYEEKQTANKNIFALLKLKHPYITSLAHEQYQKLAEGTLNPEIRQISESAKEPTIPKDFILTKMTPDEFILLADKVMAQKYPGWKTQDIDRKSVDFYKERLQKGEKLEPIYIDMAGLAEGRHKATAYKEMGFNVVDVYIRKSGQIIGTTKQNLSYQEGENKTGNNWIKQSKDTDNSKRILLTQFSSELLGTAENPLASQYFKDLYSGKRTGYVHPRDFWEIPEWIVKAAKSLPNSDVLVIRDIDETIKFLNKANYENVVFSKLDVNEALIQQLLTTYKGKVSIGGYGTLDNFKNIPNVKIYNTLDNLISDAGYKTIPGTDYRHFKNSEVIPRLCLSYGCLYQCSFCDVLPHGKVQEETHQSVTEQVKSIKALKPKLVYLSDKTFGQAKNYTKIIEINKELKKDNSNFEGFVIQTTATQFNKLSNAFIEKSGIKYVEIGVESFNDIILAEYKKPHRTQHIIEAFQKIRNNKLLAIPNILIGLKEETVQSYSNTLQFLHQNDDIISHVNAYNLAIYEDSELGNKLKNLTPEDRNEGSIKKSWMQDVSIHKQFADQVYTFGIEQLNKPLDQKTFRGISTQRLLGEKKPKLTIEEIKALKIKLRAEQKASKEGFVAGKKEVKEKVKANLAEDELNQKLQYLFNINRGIAIPYQRLIHKLTKDISLKNFDRAAIQKTKDWFESVNPEEIGLLPDTIEKIRKSFALLDIKMLSDFTLEEKQDIINTLKRLQAQGKLMHKIQRTLKEKNRKQLQDRLLKETINLDGKASLGREAGKELYLNFLTPYRVADKMDGFKENGILKEFISQEAFAEISSDYNAGLQFTDYLNQTLAIKSEWTEQELQRVVLVGLDIMQATTQRDILMEEMNLTEVPELTPQETALLLLTEQIMGQNKHNVASVYEAREGTIFPEIPRYIFALKYPAQTNIVDSTLIRQDYHNTKNVKDYFTEARKKGIKKLVRTDLFSMVKDSLFEQNWYTHMQPVLDTQASILFTQAFKNKAGDTNYSWWKNQIDITARRGYSSRAATLFSKTDQLLKQGRINLTQAILAYKLSSALAQVFSTSDAMVLALTIHKPNIAAKIIPNVLKAYFQKNRPAIYKLSKALQERTGGEQALEELFNKTDLGAFTKKGYNLLKEIDLRTAIGVQQTFYNALQGKAANSLQQAEIYTLLSQAGGGIVFRPHILGTGEKAKTVLTLQTFFLNRWGLVAHDIIDKNIIHGSNKGKIYGVAALALLIVTSLAEDEFREFLFNLITSKPTPKEKELHKKIAGATLELIPILGRVLSNLIQDKPQQISEVPIIRMTYKGIKAFKNIFTQEEYEAKVQGIIASIETYVTLRYGVAGTAQVFDLLERFVPETKIQHKKRLTALKQEYKEAVQAKDKDKIQRLTKEYKKLISKK